MPIVSRQSGSPLGKPKGVQQRPTPNRRLLLPTTYYPLPTTYYPLATTYYPLPTTHYELRTTYYTRFVRHI